VCIWPALVSNFPVYGYFMLVLSQLSLLLVLQYFLTLITSGLLIATLLCLLAS